MFFLVVARQNNNKLSAVEVVVSLYILKGAENFSIVEISVHFTRIRLPYFDLQTSRTVFWLKAKNMLFALEQWFLNWVQPNPRGSVRL